LRIPDTTQESAGHRVEIDVEVLVLWVALAGPRTGAGYSRAAFDVRMRQK